MVRLLKDILAYPYPLRVALFRGLRRLRNKYSRSHYYYRTVFNEVERPEYGYCIYKAAMLAKSLNHSRISIVELGVAKGQGLRSIEKHIDNIKREFDLDFDVFGFGLEEGLPKPEDYQDMPFKWWEGGYEMNPDSLKKELKHTKLVLGDVKETSKTFFDVYPDAAPIGAVFFDLDYYSSTRDSFELFRDAENYLPRVFCVFDDILGTNEFIGELKAIKEFNDAHPKKKFAKPYGLFAERRQVWNEKIFTFHDFDHHQYNEPTYDVDTL
ncbi:MAG: hypothetical protein QF830_03895 [Rhodospirillales bacterium]|nr:hypothetical protein [Rhodospirillales bacterium]MDP6883259.1 hypothetical protein [Rhodospirillales bacterium]